MTSGLVVMLDPDPPQSRSAVEAIRSMPAVTVGERNGRWLTAALETRDADECEQWHDALRRVPGVEDVEVVFVHWDTEDVHAGA